MADNGETMKAQDFAELVVLQFMQQVTDVSTNNCGYDVQTKQMLKVFIAVLEQMEYADVTEEQIEKLNKQIDWARENLRGDQEE